MLGNQVLPLNGAWEKGHGGVVLGLDHVPAVHVVNAVYMCIANSAALAPMDGIRAAGLCQVSMHQHRASTVRSLPMAHMSCVSLLFVICADTCPALASSQGRPLAPPGRQLARAAICRAGGTAGPARRGGEAGV